jgi:hypothetical protein
MWRNESDEVKDHYKELAEQEKSKHQTQYPDYKCSPRKSAEIKKRKRSSKECLISIEAVPATKAARLLGNSIEVSQISSERGYRNDIFHSAGPEAAYAEAPMPNAWQLSTTPVSEVLSSSIEWSSSTLEGMEGAPALQQQNDLFLGESDSTFDDSTFDAHLKEALKALEPGRYDELLDPSTSFNSCVEDYVVPDYF